MSVRFGLSQANEDAPVIYKRIESAVIIVLIPGFTAFVMSMTIAATFQKELIAGAIFFGALVKSIGVCLGQSVDTLPSGVASSTVSTTTSTVAKPDVPESKN